MEAKIIHTNCNHCDETITFDFNVDRYTTEIMIMNGKKEEARTFMKACNHCNELNVLRSTNAEEWGNRNTKGIKRMMAAGFFSCAVMVIVFALVAYFAGKGLITVWNWLF